MRIVIDAVGISQPGGGRTATLSLLHGLLAIDRENQYIVFLDRPEPSLSNWATQVQQRIVPFPNRFLARLWCQATWPVLFYYQRPNLVHFTRSMGVLGVPCRQIITIYDLAILLLPEIYPRPDVLYWRHIQPLSIRRADHIVAISQHVAGDIHRLYGQPMERIAVIYPAFRPCFQPLSQTQVAPTQAKYGLTQPYILHVGSISLKKNLPPLLEAIALLRDRGKATSLALVGREYDRARDTTLGQIIRSRGISQLVHFTGPIPDADLVGLYSGARVLAFPSLHEGFGIAPLEAMACGLPVITSGQGAMAEVTGQAGWIVGDPHSPEAWATALERILIDNDLHQQMRERGLARSADFSQAASARQMLDLYEQIGCAS